MRVQVMPGNPLYIKDGWGISFTTTHAWFLTQSCLFIILPPVQATLSPSGSGRVRLTVPERITSGAFGGVQTTLPRGPSQPVCVCVCVCVCLPGAWLARFWRRGGPVEDVAEAGMPTANI